MRERLFFYSLNDSWKFGLERIENKEVIQAQRLLSDQILYLWEQIESIQYKIRST